MDDTQAREALARVEALLDAVESQPEAMEAVAALVELYGEGLARIAAAGLPDGLADDELVSHLLVLHDLHPVPLEERARAALERMREVELVSVDGAVVTVRPLNASPLAWVEDAIKAAVPDVEAVLVEGAVPAHPEVLQIGLPQARADGAGP